MKRIPHVPPFFHAVMAVAFLITALIYAVTDIPLERITFVVADLGLAACFGSLWAYEVTERELKRRVGFLESVLRKAMR